jgi:hypothetical protein
LKGFGGDKVHVVPYTSDDKELLETMKAEDYDTMFLIPPAHKDKLEIVKQLVNVAGKLKRVQNIVFLSSVGCDVAEREKQPLI